MYDGPRSRRSSSTWPPRSAASGRTMKNPGPVLLRQHGDGPAPHRARPNQGARRSSSRSERSAPIRSHTPVPFREEELWNGYPEETNAPYGVAKKAAMVMLDAYYRAQYGLNERVRAAGEPLRTARQLRPRSRRTSFPALIRKCVDRPSTAGTRRSSSAGARAAASREFLYVDDAAEGILRAAEVMDRSRADQPRHGTWRSRFKDLVELIAGAHRLHRRDPLGRDASRTGSRAGASTRPGPPSDCSGGPRSVGFRGGAANGPSTGGVPKEGRVPRPRRPTRTEHVICYHRPFG